MSLSVLNVAFPFAPVGADSVGGSEQVLRQLDTALIRGGHRSLVLACEGSRVSGSLTTVPASSGDITPERRETVWKACRARIGDLLRRNKIDVVHMHGLDFDQYLPDEEVPVLATLHLPPRWYSPSVFGLRRPATFFNCVSRTQAEQCPGPLQPSWIIENGVDIPALTSPAAKKRGFALSLGRICPEKGYHHAIEAAREADCPFVLAGAVFGYPEHVRYFEEEIRPRLDGKRRFIGPAGFARKRRLLTMARCLLVPSTVPETSSLVTMEALACGTPVIAFPSGALPELIEEGKTGFLVTNGREMAEAIRSAGRISPETCREAARTRFSADRAARTYLAVYEKIAGCG